MTILPGFPRLDGLYDLDRKGIDIRPTLLRVLTDQYAASPRHTPEEECHYTELAMRLIDETDITTRAAVAARLARHPSAPRSIILQLARDVLEVAEPILRYSPCLTPADCEAIARERGPSYAELIAERGKPLRPSEPVPTLVQPDGPTDHTLSVRQPQGKLAPAPSLAAQSTEPAPVAAASMPARADASELCELFFAAGGPERRLILMMLEYVQDEPRVPPLILRRADIWRIESTALAHNSAGVVREIEQALGVSTPLARRIVNDEQGEPIVVAAKAMNLPNDVLQRMLLFINPAVGQSVDRVFELAALYSEISVDAARRLVAIWAEASEADKAQADANALVWRNVAENARRALSEITRADGRKRDTPSLQRGRGQERLGCG